MNVGLVGKHQQWSIFLLGLLYQTSELKHEFRALFGIGLAEQNTGAPLEGIARLMEQIAQ